jgi:hypothetical protein
MMAEGEPMPHRALWCRDSSGHEQGESGCIGFGESMSALRPTWPFDKKTRALESGHCVDSNHFEPE